MGINIRGIISTIIDWATVILLGRLVLGVILIVVAMAFSFWNSHHTYLDEKQKYEIIDDVRPSYVLNNRGCYMRFSESGELQAVKLDVLGTPDNCKEIVNIREIIEQHKENARGINRRGAFGWQVVLAGIIALVLFNFNIPKREYRSTVPHMLVIWLALFPVTFGAIYTDYNFITKANHPEYSGYVTTVYPSKSGEWYALPHTKFAKHIGGSVHIGKEYSF